MRTFCTFKHNLLLHSTQLILYNTLTSKSTDPRWLTDHPPRCNHRLHYLPNCWPRSFLHSCWTLAAAIPWYLWSCSSWVLPESTQPDLQTTPYERRPRSNGALEIPRAAAWGSMCLKTIKISKIFNHLICPVPSINKWKNFLVTMTYKLKTSF